MTTRRAATRHFGARPTTVGCRASRNKRIGNEHTIRRIRPLRGAARNAHNCSTKHEHLYAVLRERFPETEPRIVHRVYRLSRTDAERQFGAEVAATVPESGLVDVHRYLTSVIGGRRIILDVTFPGEPWDGVSALPLARGAGVDHLAGADPKREKRALEERFCDRLCASRSSTRSEPRCAEPFATSGALALGGYTVDVVRIRYPRSTCRRSRIASFLRCQMPNWRSLARCRTARSTCTVRCARFDMPARTTGSRYASSRLQ
jgi:hypothetical protein